VKLANYIILKDYKAEFVVMVCKNILRTIIVVYAIIF